MDQKESDNFKVSIILPNYNSSKYLNATINSIINQTYKNWELIIVDDNSDNATLNLLKKYKNKKNIKIFFLKKNRGAGFCRNLAIKKSTSYYIAFIDSDDLWKKNKLKKQVHFMSKNNYDFTYTNYEIFKDDKKKINKINVPAKFNFKKFTRNTSIATSSMMVKRKIIKNIKFTNSKICEDYFFKCKILKKIKFAYSKNEYLTMYRVRKGSLQSNYLKNFFWIWKINKERNKFSFFKNITSLIFISLNSIKKYGIK